MPIDTSQFTPVQPPPTPVVLVGHPPSIGEWKYELARITKPAGSFIIRRTDTNFWMVRGMGENQDYEYARFSEDRDQAIVLGGDQAIHTLGRCRNNWYCVMEKLGEPLPPLPEGKKCLIERVIAPSLIELLTAAPMNPTVRTMVHQRIKVPLPDEAQDLESIKQWIEANVEMKKVGMLPVAPVAIPLAERAIGIAIAASEYETGSCTYRRRQVGFGEVPITAHRLIEMAENSDGIGQLMEMVEGEIAENRYDYLNMENDEEHFEETSDHSSNDTQDANWELSNGPTRTSQQVMEFLREVSPTQHAILLGGEPEEGDNDDNDE